MKRIQESIIILSLIDEDLKNRDEAIIANKLHFAQFQTEQTVTAAHFTSLFNLSLINIKSYLDEYNNFFGGDLIEKSQQEKVIKVKKCLQPLSSFLQKWKGINDFRNHYLAHSMRDSKTKNIILLEPSFERYHIPNDFAELYLITNVIHIMTKIIKIIFKNEIAEGSEIFKTYSKTMSDKMSRPLITLEQAKDTILNLLNETNKNLDNDFDMVLEDKNLSSLWDKLNLKD